MRSLTSALLVLAAVALPLAASAEDPAAPPLQPPPEASRSDTGLAWVVLQPGTGDDHPLPSETVTVRYTGWKADGSVLDSTERAGRAVKVPLGAALAGWAEGVGMMSVGERRRLWIPEALAYAGREGKPKGDLVFDVELLTILRAAPVPADVAAPPADAEVTRSGLASKVLVAGTGTEHPKKRSKVEVHYTGWQTDGTLIDSSELRGEPTTFPLDAVIRGWTEGIPLMVEGERRRFWIPEKLAYRGQSGKPAGMLVFEVTLLRILD